MARILIVDDDIHILLNLEILFEKAGHEVHCTSDPANVMNIVENVPLDAVVLDIVMPHISGLDLLDRIQRHPKAAALPVILLSSLAQASDKVRGLREGAHDYVTKPYEPEELLARVEGLVARKSLELAGLQGRLEVHPFSELVAYLGQNTKTGRLHLQCGSNSGEMVIRNGKLLSSEYRGLGGTAAVLAMLEERRGTFRFHNEKIGDDGEMEGGGSAEAGLDDLQSILLTEVWLKDELGMRAQFIPEPHQGLALGSQPPRTSGSFKSVPIVQVLERIHAKPGTTLNDLVYDGLGAPMMIKLALALLFEQRALKTV